MGPYGRQWFSLQDRRPAVMAAGARAARGPRSTPSSMPSWRGSACRGTALALVGFSQGCDDGAVHRAAPRRCRRPPSSAIPARCWRPSRWPPRSRGRPPVLLVHGEADDIVPVQATRAAEAALRAAGVPVEALYRPGLAHGIDEAGLAAGPALAGSGLRPGNGCMTKA